MDVSTTNYQEMEKRIREAEKGKSFYNLAWKRFKKNKLALMGLYILSILVAIAVLAPVISPYNPFISLKTEAGLYDTLHSPTAEHLLGTDSLGRDVFSRMMYAGRISLSVGLVSVSISTALGMLLGAVAGYFGKWVDTIIMRIVDVVICFPVLFLVITVSTLLKPNIFNVMIIIGLVNWTKTARLVRGEILKVREFEFIEATHALGAKSGRIIFRHMIPNILAPLLVQATLQTAQAILTEASLSFLGVGVQQPTPSWGNMLNEAMSLSVLSSKLWVWLPPGFAILITVLCINFLGDGLRDAFDPKQVSA
jgi:peptide/nickel transport system permease protein